MTSAVATVADGARRRSVAVAASVLDGIHAAVVTMVTEVVATRVVHRAVTRAAQVHAVGLGASLVVRTSAAVAAAATTRVKMHANAELVSSFSIFISFCF